MQGLSNDLCYFSSLCLLHLSGAPLDMGMQRFVLPCFLITLLFIVCFSQFYFTLHLDVILAAWVLTFYFSLYFSFTDIPNTRSLYWKKERTTDKGMSWLVKTGFICPHSTAAEMLMSTDSSPLLRSKQRKCENHEKELMDELVFDVKFSATRSSLYI